MIDTVDRDGRMSLGVRTSDDKELPMIERCAFGWYLVPRERRIYVGA